MANLANIDMQELLTQDTVPVMLFLTLASVVCLAWVIAVQWRRVRIAEADATIKARMIEKGYSAEEIERVLQVGSEKARGRKHRHEVAVEACCS